jgi:hypothetical protein
VNPDRTANADEHYADLFAAEDDAIVTGRTTAEYTPGAVSPELGERMRRDLACARLLRDALRPAATRAAGSTVEQPVPPVPPPAPVGASLVLGPGPAASDVPALLRKRLRFISLVVVAVYTYSLSFFAINIARDPDRFLQYLTTIALTPYILTFVAAGVSMGVL